MRFCNLFGCDVPVALESVLERADYVFAGIQGGACKSKRCVAAIWV